MALTYKDIVALSKPIDYWRLGEPSRDLSTEVIANAFSDNPTWAPSGIGTQSVITQSGATINWSWTPDTDSYSNNSTASKYQYTGDFDVSIEFENYTVTGLNSSGDYAAYVLSCKAEGLGPLLNIQCDQVYVSTKNFYATNTVSGTNTNTRTNDFGGLRIARVGSTVTLYYKDGAGSWVSLLTDTVSSACRVLMYQQGSGASGSNSNIDLKNLSMTGTAVPAYSYTETDTGDNLTAVNAPTPDTSLIATDINGAFSFDGVDQFWQYVVADYRSTDTQGSIELWVRMTAEPAAASQYNMFAVGHEVDNSLFSIQVREEADGNAYVGVAWLNLGATANVVRGNIVLSAGVLYHIVVTSSGTLWKIYVNGIEDTTTDIANTNNGNWIGDLNAQDNVAIAALDRGTPEGHTNGIIDEVAYYDRPLSAHEIAKHYAAANSLEQYAQDTFYKGALNYWRMNDTAGTTCVDATGNLDLTYTGLPTLNSPSLLDTDADPSVTFNGTSQYAKIDVTDFRGTDTQGSVEFWAKGAAGNINGQVIFAVTENSTNDHRLVIFVAGAYNIYWTDEAGNVSSVATTADAFDDGLTHHVVFTSNGSVWKIYIDGIEQALTLVAGSNNGNWLGDIVNGTPDRVCIGFQDVAVDASWYDGTLDEVAYYDYPLSAADIEARYLLGKYTESYDLAVAVDNPLHWWRMDAATDDAMRNCVLYMNMEGENLGTFLENAVDPTEQPSILGNGCYTFNSAGGKKFGLSALYLDGSADYVLIPHKTEWELGGSDFTIDCWAYIGQYPSAGQWSTIVSHHSGSNGWRLLVDDTGRLHFSTNAGATNGFFGSAGDVPLQTVVHIAAVGLADGTSIGFVNGIEVGRVTGMTINTLSVSLKIGTTDGGNWFWQGYLDDLRILKGRAAWTKNFTPPTRAHGVNTIRNGYLRDSTLDNWITLGGTVTATSSRINISRNGAAYDAHGAYQGFSTIPGEAYEVETQIMAASHLSAMGVFTDTSFTVILGGNSTTSNGQTGILKCQFIAESDFSYLLLRVSNSTTGTNSWDNIKLLPAVKDEIGSEILRIEGQPVGSQPALPPASSGASILFDSSNDYLVQEVDAFGSTNSAGSIEAWFRNDGASPGSAGMIWGIGDDSGTTYYAFLYLNTTTGAIRWTLSTTAGTGSEAYDTLVTGLNDGEVHHLVVQSTGSTTKIFVDGEESGLTQVSGTNNGIWFDDLPNTDNITIGAWYGGGTVFNYFNGAIDEVAYYDYPLSANQIKSHYQTGYQRAYDRLVRSHSPVSYWKMDDTGSYAIDSIGTTDLKLIGAPDIQINSLLIGDAGQAIRFNGSSQYAEKFVADFRSTDSQGSFECWFNITGTFTQSATLLMVQVDGSALNYLNLVVRPASANYTMIVNHQNGVISNSVETTIGGLNDGITHHGVFTSNGSSWTLYVDGVDVTGPVINGTNNGNWLADFAGNTDVVRIGAIDISTAMSNFLPGTVDEVAYYSTPLTARQVYDHWIEGNNPDDTMSGNATDTSGNPVDTVRIFSWNNYKFVKAVTPDANGDWSVTLNPGEYGITYMKEGCQPITHGPYRVT